MNASDLMSAPGITIRPEATVQQAAKLMLQHNLSCLPVLNEQNGLVGILSHSDFGLSSRIMPWQNTCIPSWTLLPHQNTWRRSAARWPVSRSRTLCRIRW